MHRKDKDGNAIFDSKPRDLFTEANFRKFERSWDDGRVPTAFFRGASVSFHCHLLYYVAAKTDP
jgi:hypothetical protein